MCETERVINDLNVVKITLCNPQMLLTPEMRVRIGRVITSAIDLLKKQEPIKPTLSIDTWICPKCGHALESQELIDDKENPQVLIHEQYEYCPCCGREVNWYD